VPGVNLGWDTDYTDLILPGFHHFLLGSTLNRPRLVLSFSIHQSLITLRSTLYNLS
jgi:hypothetical protein